MDNKQHDIFTFRNKPKYKPENDTIISDYESLVKLSETLSDQDLVDISVYMTGLHHLNYNQ